MVIFLRKKLREKTKEEKVMELRKPGNKHRKKKKESKGMDNSEERFQGDCLQPS